MIKRIKFITIECIFFYTCLGISLGAVISNRTNPTIDGPSHIYNAKIINYLFSGNGFISKYYCLNKIPAANLTDHYLLALFMDFFTWQIAEKLLIVLYLLSFSLLFRMLIRQWNKTNISLSIFAIPFSFTFLYYIGFYNFCLSFPLLFAMLFYYGKYFSDGGNKPSLKNYITLCLLSTLLYFTNGLAFLFSGLTLFLFEMSLWFQFFKNKQVDSIKPIFKKMFVFFLVWIPGIICFFIFLSHLSFDSGPKRISIYELTRWIWIVRPLQVYIGDEAKFTKCIFCLICLALFVVVYFRLRRQDKYKLFSYDFFLLMSMLSLVSYFMIPDDASVGMMSIRLCYYFFIFLLIWIIVQPISKIIAWIISVLLMYIHFTLLFGCHQPVISDLNNEEQRVIDAGKVIEPNRVVLTVNVTNNWLLGHFADYLATDKTLIIQPNYEPEENWFAVNYNYQTMPELLLGYKNSALPYLINHKVRSNEIKAIDYLFIYGDYNKILIEDNWKSTLQNDYKPYYTSADYRIHIFSLKVNNIQQK